MEKVLVVVGPTASGKTRLAIKLAKKFNGEIVSADSRQVYKGLDIGTEKVSKEEMQGVPHHLIDICEPKDVFSVEEFKKISSSIIKDIIRRNKLPIIAGGTGFYIDALLYNINIPKVSPDSKLREELKEKSAEELFTMLEDKDQNRADTIDPKNRRRLIRALEIVKALGKVPDIVERGGVYETLIIGIDTDDEVLGAKIESRLEKALEKGLVEEVKHLHRDGVSWKRMDEFGLEYRIAGQFIRGEIKETQMKERMLHELRQYVKRQKTWFRRNKDIQWFSLDETEKIIQRIKDFLSGSTRIRTSISGFGDRHSNH